LIWWIVEWLFLNPNCEFGLILLILISWDIRFNINFSDSLANKKRRLKGRYEVGMSESLFGLGIKIIIKFSTVPEYMHINNKYTYKTNNLRLKVIT